MWSAPFPSQPKHRRGLIWQSLSSLYLLRYKVLSQVSRGSKSALWLLILDFHESMVCRPIPLETHLFERHLYLMIHKYVQVSQLMLQSTIPSKAFYEKFLEEIRATYSPDKIKGIYRSTLAEVMLIADGEFGAMMQVSLCNDVRSRSCSCDTVSLRPGSRNAPSLFTGQTCQIDGFQRRRSQGKAERNG